MEKARREALLRTSARHHSRDAEPVDSEDWAKGGAEMFTHGELRVLLTLDERVEKALIVLDRVGFDRTAASACVGLKDILRGSDVR